MHLGLLGAGLLLSFSRPVSAVHKGEVCQRAGLAP